MVKSSNLESLKLIKKVTRLNLKPQDTLIVSLDENIGSFAIDRIHEVLKTVFPNNPIVIDCLNCKFKIIRSEKEEIQNA